MDPVRNPYAPGAGSPPPELAGRKELRDALSIALQRVRNARSAKSVLLIGLRGVGKTVLLNQMQNDAQAIGIETLMIEAPENRSLPAILAPRLHMALLRLSRNERAKALATRALRALSGFTQALRVKYQDIEIRLDFDPEPGLADNGDLEQDLQDLLEAVGAAAKEAQTALALFVDELQYVEQTELAALITALHRASQRQVPIVLIGAGLPQLRGRMGDAKSYAERLFDFLEVGALSAEAARTAIEKPALEEGVKVESAAMQQIITETQCYPYFLQEWGKHAWEIATDSVIKAEDAKAASVIAVAALDESFFRVRFDRLRPTERRYLRAMAELGAGPHRSGEVAKVMGREVSSLAPVRSQLIGKGMVWSPNHGDTAFTVPLFDGFMRRIMPGGD